MKLYQACNSYQNFGKEFKFKNIEEAEEKRQELNDKGIHNRLVTPEKYYEDYRVLTAKHLTAYVKGLAKITRQLASGDVIISGDDFLGRKGGSISRKFIDGDI